MDYKLHNGSLYKFSLGVYVGVLVKESTMKKMAKEFAKYRERISLILHDEADKGNVFPHMWTLHYPDNKQTTVNFISTSDDTEQRIEGALTVGDSGITHCPLVFIAGSMDEAKEMADAHHKEAGGAS